MRYLSKTSLQQEAGKTAEGAEAAEMLAKIEGYCQEHSLSHFLMSSEDDLGTIEAAFEFIIDGSLKISLQKRRYNLPSLERPLACEASKPLCVPHGAHCKDTHT